MFPTDSQNPRPVAEVLEAAPGPDQSLRLLSNGELELMQNITLSQMRDAREETALLLLGRVWYRLEGERRRRKNEVIELEQLYFAS